MPEFFGTTPNDRHPVAKTTGRNRFAQEETSALCGVNQRERCVDPLFGEDESWEATARPKIGNSRSRRCTDLPPHCVVVESVANVGYN
jgi:hypothetical protein